MTGLRSNDGTPAGSDFDRILDAVVALLREHGRVSYRGLKRRFALDDDYVEDLKVELIQGRRVARDEAGQVLVWIEQPALPAADGGQAHPARATDSAERRQLTIMFCDLVSSTELSTRIDPEEYRDMMLRYHAVCAAAVARYGGHVAQYLGDGLQVYFGYPTAQDDAAARAIHAALAIVQQLTAAEDAGLPVRIGVHSGVVVVGEIGITGPGRDWLALGETPNLAARVQALAAPNSVVVTAATRALLRERFLFEALGEHTLRGVARPMALYRPLAAERPVASSTLQPPQLFGRCADLAMLRARFEAAREGTGQLVAVNGEPGIGKSCLIRAFAAQLDPAVEQWECRCSAFHTGTALHPLAELLRKRFGIDANDSLDIGLRKLRAQLEACFNDCQLGRVEDTFGALLSLGKEGAEPVAQRQRTIELLTSFLLARADREPVVLIVEDLHWADPSTLELLRTLIVQARATHTMILVSHRPGFDVASCEPEQRTTVTLERLAPSDAAELLRSATAGKELPDEVTHELLDRAGGMPLFLEEMARMLLDSELLRDRGTHYELARPLSSVGIPSTITDSLMARLDQLGRAREVAQIGSVLGRSFSYELIQAVWQRGEQALCDYLAHGVRSGLLLQRGFPPNATFTFKHALVQETAYSTLVRREKRAIHARAAGAMLSVLPQLAAAQPELVAHHFSEAHEFDAASRYYQRAAEHACKTAANVEAVGHLCKALDQLLALPHTSERDRREVSLLLQLLPPLIATRGYAAPEVAAACERAHAVVKHNGSARERWPVIWGLWYNSEIGGAFARADVLAAELERLASESASDEFELQLCIVRGHAFYRGRLREARAHFERALLLYVPGSENESVRFGQDPCVVALSYLSCIAVLFGESARGAELAESAIAHARKLRHPHSLALALSYAGASAQLRCDRPTLRRYVNEQLTLCREHGFDFWLAHGETLLAWADAFDDPARGLAALQQAYAHWQASGARLWQSHQLVLVAEVHLQLGQIDEGIAVIDGAEAFFEPNGECLLAAELLRLRCEQLMRKESPDLAAARSGLRRALAIATEQGAVLIEQRTQRSLRKLAKLEAAAARAQVREIN